MDSYLVRIYRRQEDNPRLLVGVVEQPGDNGKKAFHNLYELWDILNSVKRTTVLFKGNKNSRLNGNTKRGSRSG